VSSPNVEALRRVYDRFAAGDFREATRIYDPQVEWKEVRPVPGAGEFKGMEAVRAGFIDWLSTWEDYRLDLLELIDGGNRVFAAVRGHGRGKLSGAYAEDHFFQVWTMRGDRVVKIENHADREEALRAAGLDKSALR
jgi:hypothetical protein